MQLDAQGEDRWQFVLQLEGRLVRLEALVEKLEVWSWGHDLNSMCERLKRLEAQEPCLTEGECPPALQLWGAVEQLEAKQQTDRRMSEAHDKRFEKLEARLKELEELEQLSSELEVEHEDRLEALEQYVNQLLGAVYGPHAMQGPTIGKQQAAPPKQQPREGAGQ